MRSSSIPFERHPPYDALIYSINEGFSYFKKKLPTVTLEIYGQGGREVFVKGDRENEWCWVSIFTYPGEQKDNNDCPFTCAIESRGNNIFSAIVTYALGRKFGKIIYDDAGYLVPGQEFAVDEFEYELQEQLLSLK